MGKSTYFSRIQNKTMKRKFNGYESAMLSSTYSNTVRSTQGKESMPAIPEIIDQTHSDIYSEKTIEPIYERKSANSIVDPRHL